MRVRGCVGVWVWGRPLPEGLRVLAHAQVVQEGAHLVRAQGSGCRVQGAGFRVQGAGVRVQGAGFRVQGSGFRVEQHTSSTESEVSGRVFATTVVRSFPGCGWGAVAEEGRTIDERISLTRRWIPCCRQRCVVRVRQGNLGANLKSISHRCQTILAAFVWELTKETTNLPLGCLQGGILNAPFATRSTYRGTSLIRPPPLLGPYGGPQGGVCFL